MNWEQKCPNLKTVREVVEAGTGIPASEFLHPPKDPYLRNLTEAVSFVKDAINKDIPIKIIGDYDADGICASSILAICLREASGKEPEVRLPRRFSEGYGLSMKIIDETERGLIVTVDNGIAAIEQIRAAKEKGLSVVVIDHHLPVRDPDTNEIILPDADVILDPHAISGSAFYYYCGAGLAYRFAKELIPGSPTLIPLLSLASIATVTDMVPLVGDNRNIVIEGLEAVRKRNVTLGLNTLLNELNLTYVDEGDYGYKLGPIMNAAGRLYDDGPMEVFKLLKTHVTPAHPDYTKTLISLQEKAEKLVKDNEKRRELVRKTMPIARQILIENGLQSQKPIVIYDPRFSEGIIGIIAGNLAEEYRTPALVLTDSKTPGVLKGSGRTYGTVHLKQLLDRSASLLEGYGGHSEAAGVSVKHENLTRLREHLKKELDGVDFGVDPDTSYYDLTISAKDVAKNIREVSQYAPYGQGNPPIVFQVQGFECSPVAGKFVKTMGEHGQHIKFLGKDVSAVGFDMRDRYVGEGEPKVLDFVGSLTQNYYKGVFYNQIEVHDFKPVKKKETKERKSLEELLVFT